MAFGPMSPKCLPGPPATSSGIQWMPVPSTNSSVVRPMPMQPANGWANRVSKQGPPSLMVSEGFLDGSQGQDIL